MKNSKRIVVGFVVLAAVYFILYIFANLFQEKEYKYLTLENEWGISSDCYVDNDQFAICEIDEVLTIVRQFYESNEHIR